MIKTLEQYKEMFRTTSYSELFGRFVPGGWGVVQIEDAQELIESLRAVARAALLVYRDMPAAEIAVEREGHDCTPLISLRLADVLLALDACPPWALEE